MELASGTGMLLGGVVTTTLRDGAAGLLGEGKLLSPSDVGQGVASATTLRSGAGGVQRLMAAVTAGADWAHEVVVAVVVGADGAVELKVTLLEACGGCFGGTWWCMVAATLGARGASGGSGIVG